MQSKFVLFSLMSCIFVPSLATAGGMEGGGGKVVICPSANGNGTSVELLDIWEARTLYGKNAISVSDLSSGVEHALELLKGSYPLQGWGPVGGSQIFHDQELTKFWMSQTAAKFLHSDPSVLRLKGDYLTPTDDAFELVRPKNCEIGQVVDYTPAGQILVDQDLYEQLDLTNQAALIAHESLYRFLKGVNQEANSIRVRRAIGYVFSGSAFTYTPDYLPKRGLRCSSKSENSYLDNSLMFSLSASTDGKKMIRISQTFLNGTALMGVQNQWWEIPENANDEVLLTGKCSQRPDVSGYFALTFDGPVEFDRYVALRWSCDHGVLNASLDSFEVGTGVHSVANLKCSLGG